ncbi:hypothetical protein SAMN05444395_11037 [Flavobacterium fryxellicola]|uniref:Uncharacterized protein n=1 Tax=Flavobacterium fryxellicola TaxID=249352 RepID=A0A167ZEV7_9FLAO|nr:hypothetical protein [Flavobacterium fryxellicola]OAB30375.1 hypothetical protein FBFR_02320 [Flavobacterium fryxellicola]SHN76096.1 hypothetical protein SAMN05444395_11037 [Flavobacterium fryxellicola]
MKNNSKNIIFDFSKFKKIEDIIFLDEPILTHLTSNKKHFLLYLVDTIENSDIYLLLELTEDIIFQYLIKSISLKKIILENENISFLIEQDFYGNVTKCEVIQSQSISENYLPNEDSYLDYIPTEESYYFNFIEEFKANSYLQSLRQNAFYLKFAPNNLKYSDTIGLTELANLLLSNISLSFKNFLKADFFLEFKETITEKSNLNNIFNKILPELDLRMVDLKYGSFEIGLAVDKVMKNSIEDKAIKNWAIEVGTKYKKLVLDDDYDKDTVNQILESYDEDDRKKIFNPIFKITENPNFSLQIKNSVKSTYKTIKIKDKSIIEKIVPKNLELNKKEEVKDYQIIQVTTVLDKNNSSKTIKLEDSLFSSSNNTKVFLTNKDFEKHNYSLNFQISIPLQITTEKNSIKFSANYDNIDFEVIYSSDKIDEGITKITSKIFEYITNLDE